VSHHKLALGVEGGIMRRSLISSLLAVFSFAVFPLATASADVSFSVDVGVFHDALAPQGRWIHHDRWGDVWTPSYVAHGWRPYSVGHWVYTDFGWTWASDEDWGWATYHYGRWVFDPDQGWLWIPGSEWAPAWVAWRSGGGYVGWAPLPADEIRYGVRYEPRIEPFAYCFVEERHLVHPSVFSLVVPVARNVTFIATTANFTHYDVVDHRVFNRGIEVERVERVSGHAVPRLQVTERRVEGRSHVDAHAGRFEVFRPTARVTVTPIPARVDRGRAEEVHALERAEANERQHLEATHRSEDHRPPAGISHDELQARHDAELRAQQEHEARERASVERHQQAEHAQPRAKDDDKHKNPHQR
jgi:hypothetical protein